MRRDPSVVLEDLIDLVRDRVGVVGTVDGYFAPRRSVFVLYWVDLETRSRVEVEFGMVAAIRRTDEVFDGLARFVLGIRAAVA